MITHEDIKRIKRREELDKKRATIECSNGFEAWTTLWTSRMSYLIFLENNRSLKLNIKQMNSIDLICEAEEMRWRKQRKLVRDLHNTVGSGFSFKDHLNYRNNYTESSESNDISLFFKFLRNFLIHIDTFPLISKMEWNRGVGILRYQAMEKQRFSNYLQLCLTENKKSQDSKAQKSRKQIEKLVNYIHNFSEPFNFEQIYKKYLEYIILYHHRWLKKIVKKNIKELKGLLAEIEDYENQVINHYQLVTASLKESERYLKENISILTDCQRRYLKILVNKKSWNKKALHN